jgi:multicomponent Na+:H+ antiporter subunit D
MALAMFTMVYGCSRAVKETHIKRRLAYSTVSNLSYIIFGVTIMTPLGLVGAPCHLVCHAVMKICSFMCAGAFMHQTGKKYIFDMDGIGKKMPVIFFCLGLSGMGLMGVPGLAGFISKWNLTKAAVDSQNPLAYWGIVCLLISALLTAIYMMSIMMRAFFPAVGFDDSAIAHIKDPGWKMCLPIVLCAVFTVLLGIFSTPLVDFLTAVAAGL